MKDVLSLLQNNQISKIKDIVSETNSIDIAEFIEGLSSEKTLRFFRILPKDIAAEVFSYLSSEKQQGLIEKISDEELSHIFQEMFLDDTVDLIDEMPADIVEKILRNSTPQNRQLINLLLKYPENSAGGLMTVEYVSLKSDMSVNDAFTYIRRNGLKNETIEDCYIVDQYKTFLGKVTIKDLIFNSGNTLLSEIMDTETATVHTIDDAETVADLFRKYDITSMPVLDHDGRLVGIITIDDIVDIIDQMNTEEFHKMAGINPTDEEYLKECVFDQAKRRILWLLVLMISATATGIIIRKYEVTLQSVVILASFIPMLMGTGGNAGAQSSTLIIRGLAVGDILLSDLGKVVWKEFRVSILVGIALSLINFARIYFLEKTDLTISIVVCASLFLTVIMAKVIGGMLPIAAKSLKMDPSIMASPLITTIVDACALFVYFSLATKFLGL